jgi:NitT/TauT family transport system substrate-binding protein
MRAVGAVAGLAATLTGWCSEVEAYRPFDGTDAAVLKATDLCDSEPKRVAKAIADRGFADRYDPLLQTLKDNPYKWREYNAEDTMRFWALRLREVGFIKSSPQKILAGGTDWRYLDEVKRELKA